MNNLKEEKAHIIFLKADANYTVFFLDNGKKYVSAYNLKKHEEKDELKNFIRVNRAYLVNPKHIVKTETKNSVTSVVMSNGITTKLSRRRTLFENNTIIA